MTLNSNNKYHYLEKGEVYKLEFELGAGIQAIITNQQNYALKTQLLFEPMEILYLGEVGVDWEYWDTIHYMHKFFYKDTFFCFTLENLCIEEKRVKLKRLS